MADIFVSYTRADQELVRRLVALLEAQDWSVWWDTRIIGGERWDATIEREITAARCVVVVWTPRSFDREWVHLEAHHGRKRGILAPVLYDVDEPPFAFSLIQARNLSSWDGATKTAVVVQFLADVRRKLDGVSPRAQLSSSPPSIANSSGEAEREWRIHDLDSCGDSGLLLAYATKWETADRLWSYKAQQRAAALDAAQRRRAEAESDAAARREHEAAICSYQAEGRIRVDAKIIHGAPDGWFKPGAGATEWFKDLDVGPEMVVVPPGSFIMGEAGFGPEKKPLHEVTFGAPFAVGRFAVTFAEWDAAGLAHKPRDHGWGRARRPVMNVSWEDAKAYVSWLSLLTSKAYRLLSEAEWEYCCRAETTTKYAFGDSITMSQAQFAMKRENAERTAEVGSFPPNGWGLYDMHGNVWEWCADNWHGDYKGAPQDGSVWAGGEAPFRVLRGGSWIEGSVSSGNRSQALSGSHTYDVGFRVARTL